MVVYCHVGAKHGHCCPLKVRWVLNSSGSGTWATRAVLERPWQEAGAEVAPPGGPTPPAMAAPLARAPRRLYPPQHRRAGAPAPPAPPLRRAGLCPAAPDAAHTAPNIGLQLYLRPTPLGGRSSPDRPFLQGRRVSGQTAVQLMLLT